MNPIFLTEDRYRDTVSLLGNASVFLFFALLLATKSGHSLAMVLMLVTALLAIPLKRNGNIPKEIKFASGFLVFLGFFWSHTFDDIFSLSLKGDYLARYMLGAWLLVVFSKVPIHPRAVLYGLSAGGIAAGILAAMQYAEIGRAEGFTNAIRFGNIAMLMALVCGSAWFFTFFQKKERFLFLVAAGLAGAASILSLSRGGWLMLLALPCVVFFIFQDKRKYATYLVLAMVPALFMVTLLPPVKERIVKANTEITGYFADKDQYVTTSLGARLEQWKVALWMGAEKPVTGWGDAAIEGGKLDYIQQSHAHPSIMNYNHAHNDFIETWARRGAVGVVILFFVYGMPVYLILLAYTANKKITNKDKNLHELNKLFLIFGCLVYSGYLVFGLSDVFFTFVISHNFYIFTLICTLSVLQWIQRQATAPPAVHS